MNVPSPSRMKSLLVPAKAAQWSFSGCSVDDVVLARLGDLGEILDQRKFKVDCGVITDGH